MAKINACSTVWRSEAVLMAQVDGETVMMDARKGVYYGLDAIGSEIWARLKEPVTVERLLAQLAEEFDGAPDEMERDVIDLLSNLAEHGLLEVGP
jgi:Coenzyme PQQ synthesis protein D (PqqD).